MARQYRMVVCRKTLVVKKMKKTKAEKRTKWWKLKKEDCCVAHALGDQEVFLITDQGD